MYFKVEHKSKTTEIIHMKSKGLKGTSKRQVFSRKKLAHYHY